jgi:hypothetical protein
MRPPAPGAPRPFLYWENVGFHCLCRTCITPCWRRITPSVEKGGFETPPRYVASIPHAVTNFRGSLQALLAARLRQISAP